LCKPLGKYLAGWKAYFRLAETPGVFADLDQWFVTGFCAVQPSLERGTVATVS